MSAVFAPSFVQAVIRRDSDAWQQLVRQMHGPLVSYAAALLRDGELGAEVVQDAWARAWVHAPSFRPLHASAGAGLHSWLYRIVTNRCMDHLRHQQVMETLPLSQAALNGGDWDADRGVNGPGGGAVEAVPEQRGWNRPLVDEGPGPEEMVLRREEASEARALVLWLLRRLPPRERHLLARQAAGASYRDLARQEGESVLAVKSTLHRARERVKRVCATTTTMCGLGVQAHAQA